MSHPHYCLEELLFYLCDLVSGLPLGTSEDDRIWEVHFQMHGHRVNFSSRSTLVPGEALHEIMCTG